MQDVNALKELDKKSIEIIFGFKPNGKVDAESSKEIEKLRNAIKIIVGILPKEDREIFDLKYVYKLTNNQIAGKTGKTVEEIEQTILDAIKTVKNNIKDRGLDNIVKDNKNSKKEDLSTKKTTNKNSPTKPQEPSKEAVLFVNIVLTFIFWSVILTGGYFIGKNFIFKNMPSPGEMLNRVKYMAVETTTTTKSQGKTKKRVIVDKEPNNIKIAGSSSLLSLSRRWENAISIEFPKLMINVISTNSDRGINSLIEGSIDIANTSRPLLFSDTNKALRNGIDLQEHRVAIDALIIVVNKNNPIDVLSLENLENIFSGEVSNWSKYGNFGEQIVPIVRQKGSGTNSFVKNRILRGHDFSYSIKRIASSREIMRLVSQNKGAISFINSTSFPWDIDGVKYIKIKSYDDSYAVPPFEGRKLNEEAMRYGDYPLAHYLYLITHLETTEKVASYVNWVLGKEGQKTVRKLGLVPVSEG